MGLFYGIGIAAILLVLIIVAFVCIMNFIALSAICGALFPDYGTKKSKKHSGYNLFHIYKNMSGAPQTATASVADVYLSDDEDCEDEKSPRIYELTHNEKDGTGGTMTLRYQELDGGLSLDE